jgi:hypothetical protein
MIFRIKVIFEKIMGKPANDISASSMTLHTNMYVAVGGK